MLRGQELCLWEGAEFSCGVGSELSFRGERRKVMMLGDVGQGGVELSRQLHGEGAH
jgi:hypothetical protein